MKRIFSVAFFLVLVALFISTDISAQGRWNPNLRAKQITLRPVALTGTAGAQVLPAGSFFLLAGTTKQTSITTSAADAGRFIILLCATTDTLVDASNLKLAGDFEGTADDILVLVSNGTNWYEVGRSVN